jgi:outer membrane receptor protein involved in Fe transport
VRVGTALPLGLRGDGYAILQSVKDADGNRLPYVPQAQALGRLVYERPFFPSHNLTVRASIDSRVVGPRTTISGADLPAFAQMDVLLRARLIGFTAGISVQNVFGQRVRTEEDFPRPGRLVGLEIFWEFWD